MLLDRRSCREMSQRRRHQGLSQMDMHHIEVALRFLLTLLGRAMAIPIGILRTGILLLGLPLLQGILAMFSTVYTTLDPVNPANKDRLINLYTEE